MIHTPRKELMGPRFRALKNEVIFLLKNKPYVYRSVKCIDAKASKKYLRTYFAQLLERGGL